MLVFIHINKTAGRTVRYILRSSYGVRHCEVEPWHTPASGTAFSSDDLRRVRRVYPSLASIAGHSITGYADLEEKGTTFEYLTFLREPVKLCASRFQYQIDYRKKKDLVFDEWIEREWVRNVQTRRIAGTDNAGDAIDVITRKNIFVGLTERFDESMVLLNALRAPDLDIGYTPINVARRNTVAEELLSSASTRQALVDANTADAELYDYVVNELYPTFQREYGPALDEAVARYRSDPCRKFNRRRLTTSRLKQYAVYRPLLRVQRLGTGGTNRAARD